jgi:hypothetical protein
MKYKWMAGMTPVGMVAGMLVFLGALLAVTVDMRFLLLTGMGAFGPGFLRVSGVLKDQDEFARLATYKAGYYASLFAGSAAIILISGLKAGTVDLDDSASQAFTIILAIIWLVSVFASLHRYWGVQKAVFRILIIFGSLWFVFVVLSHGNEPLTALMESLVVLPFFILAWVSLRWPRVAGALIVTLGIFCFFLFRMYQFDRIGFMSTFLTFLLFICPLLVAGLALLLKKQEDNDNNFTDGGEDHV